MKRLLAAAVAAFAYFTALPVRSAPDAAPDGSALAFLPLAGTIVGSLSGFGALLVSKAAAQPWPALTAFTLGIVLTGAIHVDGFLDSCDAVFASVSSQRRLEILKDPRHGTYAVVGMALLASFWIAALLQLPPRHLVVALAIASGGARLCTLPVVWTFPYAGAGSADRRFRPGWEVAIVAAGAAVTFVLASSASWWALLAVLAAAGIALGAGSFCASRLGGVVTGDTYGAAIVVSEVCAVTVLGFVPWR